LFRFVIELTRLEKTNDSGKQGRWRAGA